LEEDEEEKRKKRRSKKEEFSGSEKIKEQEARKLQEDMERKQREEDESFLINTVRMLFKKLVYFTHNNPLGNLFRTDIYWKYAGRSLCNL